MSKKLIWVDLPTKKWLRGEGSDKSRLLRFRDKKMCCLGIACEVGGVKRRALAGQADLSDLAEGVPPVWMKMPTHDWNVWADLYNINDDNKGRFATDAQRVAALNDRLRQEKAAFRFRLKK